MTMVASTRRSPQEFVFAVVWVTIMLLIVFAFGAFVRLATSAIPACQKHPAHLVTPPVIILACAGCFYAGSRIRQWRVRQVRHAPGTALAGVSIADPIAVAGFAVLTVFFFFVVILLAYETYAVAHAQSWPITFYVRCAYAVAPNWTAVAACCVSFLFGHWFW